MSAVPAPSAGRRLAWWLVLVLALAALNYAGRFAGGAGSMRDLVYRWDAVVLGAGQFGVLLALALWLAGPRRRALLAWRAPRRWLRALALAVGVVVGTLVVASLLLEPILHAGEEQGLTPPGWDPSRAPQFAANFLVIAALAPVVEELLFRGLGYSLLRPRLGAWGTIVAVGVLFGLAHGLVRGLPILALFGMALAWLRSRTDSVAPCIATHALFNAFALIASVTFESSA